MNLRIFRHPWLVFCLRLLVGGVILYAGLSKIGDLSGMAQVIENYRLLPASLVNPCAIVLPGVEIITGLCVIAGLLLKGSRLIATALIVSFLAAILWAISQGLDIECGCFGTSDAERVDWAVFLRDLVFLLFTIPIWLAWENLLALDVALFRRQISPASTPTLLSQGVESSKLR
ncbi:MAG: MauE/DoxX family redox-associated membrane protein [bacterium]